jgi:hypothetical protein
MIVKSCGEWDALDLMFDLVFEFMHSDQLLFDLIDMWPEPWSNLLFSGS